MTSIINKAIDVITSFGEKNVHLHNSILLYGGMIQIFNEGNYLLINAIQKYKDSEKGVGRKIMQTVLSVLDQFQVECRLYVLPYGNKYMTTEELIAWYKRLGFEETGNLNMVRKLQTKL